ncbi:hypothetical protein FHT02_003128 [Sphingomonas xinjiangensis]|uniref:DUF2332 domain-containing protein n=1 Tax=Sphingomonas xinjiangensis TaxID=643568 RepID=A0A840YNL2_9SPHN|nr:hypothetical protein [Sphingomonas xinjiangensis]
MLEAGERHLHSGPRTAALIKSWPGDAASAAVALRFNAGVHALARSGRVPRLSALFRREHTDYDGALSDALGEADDFIADWMATPTQTNEVARAGALAAALMVLARDTGKPVELLELGSSCGLNLNLARYRYDLGGVTAGDPDSAVTLRPAWQGSQPPAEPIRIMHARGVDLDPLDPLSAVTRERLLSFVWADQPARMARLEAALEVARNFVPKIERGDALDWLPRQMHDPQSYGICRVVMHSMVEQYFKDADRERFELFLEQAGKGATTERPIARISFEWTPARDEVQLALTQWPSGSKRLLAVCHPYGEWIHWCG